MKIRAVASILISSGKPIRAAAEFVSAIAATSYAAIAVAAVPAQTIRAEIYIPQILPLAASVTPTDQINNFAIGKVLIDVANTEEQIAFTFHKVLEDHVTVTDVISKSFIFSGDMDPETPGVDPDYVTTGDQIDSITVGKVLADSVVVGDVIGSFTVDKVLTDSVTASDSAALTVGKTLTDSVTASDSVSTVWDAQRTFTDDVTATDNAVLAVDKVLSDTATASDAVALTVDKALADSVTATDTATFATTKVLADAVSATDAIDTIAVGKVLADSVTPSDAAVLTTDKILSDAVTADDSGTAVLSMPGLVNYHQVNYVAVDGDVTEETSFT